MQTHTNNTHHQFLVTDTAQILLTWCNVLLFLSRLLYFVTISIIECSLTLVGSHWFLWLGTLYVTFIEWELFCYEAIAVSYRAVYVILG